ncbi:hypothetical protein A4R35_22465 [Thermogemmatispora tikiterensis]|uniref:Uncharacterized protein n=1 Tax=Thermogemmatispora tikiterensis TaxID=1825093 RepID=A0A328VNA1_9CHLR|nr:hypothetical protein A4R35_22465 [Thermogemmatispora tikiterensis]
MAGSGVIYSLTHPQLQTSTQALSSPDQRDRSSYLPSFFFLLASDLSNQRRPDQLQESGREVSRLPTCLLS